MKYALVIFLRKVSSFLMALFMGFGSSSTIQKPKKPEMDTVSMYNEETADYSLKIDATKEIYNISDLLFGIFFEDISFAADGGLYGEKVANRSFEFTPLAKDDELFGYVPVNGAELKVNVDSDDGLNENNKNYVTVTNGSFSQSGIGNVGFMEGMSISPDEEYNLSFYAKSKDYSSRVYAKIVSDGIAVASSEIQIDSRNWKKYSVRLKTSSNVGKSNEVQLLIDNGSIDLDMISLFDTDTFMGRENGLRRDLCEKLQGLTPKFLRFPGGCVIEGYDKNTAYNWKDSIGVDSDGNPLMFNGHYGDVAARRQGINIWTDLSASNDPYPSFMSYGLGFYEFFLLSEDLGAAPVPVLNCGLNCQMRGKGPTSDSEKEQYKQDMLDLVEFCKGDETTKWGKVRVSMGHEEPFDLKYICIGNENEGTDYYERYTEFLECFNDAKKKNPSLYGDIELIYSAGASDATHGVNYKGSYSYAKSYLTNHGDMSVDDFAGAIDQHYYNAPEWFRKNTDYYDAKNYRRETENMDETSYGGALKVFLGEYAAQSNKLKAALAEAAYMTGLERNGDIVKMAAYAPLFGNATASHWSPDLIWLNQQSSSNSINYYVQKLFSNHQGKTLVESTLSGAAYEPEKLKGNVGVGTWYTSAEFDNVKVYSNDTREILEQDNFTLPGLCWKWQKKTDGKFRTKNGKMVQMSTDMKYSETGSVAYLGDTDWSDYTYELTAKKLDGQEGFLIPFAANGVKDNWFWNIGGFGNTVSCLQHISGGVKDGQIPSTIKDFTVETGKEYKLKVVISGYNVKCYIDNVLYIDYDTASTSDAECYQVSSIDENGNLIVKIVNVTGENQTLALDISSNDSISRADVYRLFGENEADENVFGKKEKCSIDEFHLDNLSDKFNYTVPQYSVTVLEFK